MAHTYRVWRLWGNGLSDDYSDYRSRKVAIGELRAWCATHGERDAIIDVIDDAEHITHRLILENNQVIESAMS